MCFMNVKQSCNDDWGSEVVCKEYIIGREPVSIVHYTKSRICVNCTLP